MEEVLLADEEAERIAELSQCRVGIDQRRRRATGYRVRIDQRRRRTTGLPGKGEAEAEADPIGRKNERLVLDQAGKRLQHRRQHRPIALLGR